MKAALILKYILTILLFTTASFSAEKELIKGKLGYLIDGLDMIKYKDTRVAFRLWTKEFLNDKNVEIQIDYYDSQETFIDSYKKHKFDYLTMNSYYYLKYKDIIDKNSKQYWVIRTAQSRYEKYLILTKKDSGIKSLKDLKNKRIAIKRENYLGELFLDKEFYQQTSTGYKNYIEELAKTSKFTTAVLDTFFGKVDACVVPSEVLDIMSELNPVIKKQLITLVKSDNIFIPVVTLFHKNTKPQLINKFKEHLKELENSPRGKNIMDLFKMKSIDIVEREEFEPMYKYYESYLKLKTKK